MCVVQLDLGIASLRRVKVILEHLVSLTLSRQLLEFYYVTSTVSYP